MGKNTESDSPLTIKMAVDLYSELKKDNLSDVEIRKIAQILLAFTINEKHWP